MYIMVAMREGGRLAAVLRDLPDIKAPVEALGGAVEVVADFGDRRVVIG